jgi:hypothetical protein
LDSGHLIWLGPQTNKWEKQVSKFLKKHTSGVIKH